MRCQGGRVCKHNLSYGADTNTLRVPEVIGWGDYTHGSYLITEYLEFGGRADQAEMGRLLAQMHLATPKV